MKAALAILFMASVLQILKKFVVKKLYQINFQEVEHLAYHNYRM